MIGTRSAGFPFVGAVVVLSSAAFLAFFFLMIVPVFMTVALVCFAVPGFGLFYLWHWATRASPES